MPDFTNHGATLPVIETNVSHSLLDTHYHEVSYEVTGVACADEELLDKKTATNAQFPVSGAQAVSALNTARPAPAKILFACPIYSVEKEGMSNQRYSKLQTGIRVYLDAREDLTGANELFGVLIHPGACRNIPDALIGKVTIAASDPVYEDSPRNLSLQADSFSQYEHKNARVFVDGVSEALTVIGFTPKATGDKPKPWYIDIPIDNKLLPCFWNLSIVRYQPKSIEGAYISQPRLVGYMPISGGRSVNVFAHIEVPMKVKVMVTESGIGIAQKRWANIRLEKLVGLPANQWVPVEDVPGLYNQDIEVKKKQIKWDEVELTLPSEIPISELRIVVEDLESNSAAVPSPGNSDRKLGKLSIVPLLSLVGIDNLCSEARAGRALLPPSPVSSPKFIVSLDSDLRDNWTKLTPFSVQGQKASNWCWIATAVSVNKFYTPNSSHTQCNLAGSLQNNIDCCSGNNKDSAACNNTGSLKAALIKVSNHKNTQANSISFEAIKQEISSGGTSGHPVCYRVKWIEDNNEVGHVSPICGYESEKKLIFFKDVDGAVDNSMKFSDFPGSYKPGSTWSHTYFCSGTHSEG